MYLHLGVWAILFLKQVIKDLVIISSNAFGFDLSSILPGAMYWSRLKGWEAVSPRVFNSNTLW